MTEPQATGSGRTGSAQVPAVQRSSAEIRADIVRGRQDLGQSVEQLRDKVNEVTDWRMQVRTHQREIAIGAAAVGFAIGAMLMLRGRS